MRRSGCFHKDRFRDGSYRFLGSRPDWTGSHQGVPFAIVEGAGRKRPDRKRPIADIVRA